jgi:acetolactate decarboxylase
MLASMRHIIVISALVLSACHSQTSDSSLEAVGQAAPSPTADTAQTPPDVTWYGNLKSIFAGNWSSAVELDGAVSSEHAYGLGALADLRGEFIVVDGNVMLSYPTAEPIPRVVAAHRGSSEAATLLVTASVPRWREMPLEEVLAANLEEAVRAAAEASSLDSSKPFPFLLRGTLRNIAWHVADGTRVEPGMRPDTNAQQGTIASAEATVVGFYSTQHQGIFTMMGQNSHMHVVLSDHSVVGHVRALDTARGTVLSLPR